MFQQARIPIPILEYLGYRHFGITFVLSLILHFIALIVWSAMPHMRIIDVPVRVINIRLGDSDLAQIHEDDTAQQDDKQSNAIEEEIKKLVRDIKPPKETRKPSAPKVEKPTEKLPETHVEKVTSEDLPDISNSTPRQFVRFKGQENAIPKNEGSVLGNSTEGSADVKVRYEQLISLWIQKFKLYPEKSRSQGIQGKTIVRIRIDRFGNVRYSALESSTGNTELDQAALDMVRRANPVPAVPESYPAGELFEFLIPVKFQIQ